MDISNVDPISYEILTHRLWAIGEEGRATIQRVSASPIVTQGGECMQSFYDDKARMILACAGHLRFAAATSEAIVKLKEWFADDPGFSEGDQIFMNDPYVAGAHTYDQMTIMPIFHQGRIVAWTAGSSHTADTGGLLRDSATEIYHEGIRIPGLKIVEAGHFRKDVCKTLVDQCRDPYYVELDIRSRVAGNYVAAQRVKSLIDRFGIEFCLAAFDKMVVDAERMARARLRSLPDGVWRSRAYNFGQPGPYQVVCVMRKQDDELELDFTGTSEQRTGVSNSPHNATLAQISVALTSTLFWDLPWNDGKLFPVSSIIPEGSVINCRFPAACGGAPAVGGLVVAAVTECIAKMLYLGGRYDDVNAGARSLWYGGGAGAHFGGHNQHGVQVAQGLYDSSHGAGFGATPTRDGVDSAGSLSIPSVGMSDVERIEMQYPLLHLTRNHQVNGGGYGEFRGGAGTQRVMLVYGSEDFNVPMAGYEGVQHGFGLFGGFPVGTGGFSGIFRSDGEVVVERMLKEAYPTTPAEIMTGAWGQPIVERGRHVLPEWSFISYFASCGGGLGDPLDRDPEQVAQDVRHGFYSKWAAEKFYGVILDQNLVVDGRTHGKREEIRIERLKDATNVSRGDGRHSDVATLMVPHGQLDIVDEGDVISWRCRSCHLVLGPSSSNYKIFAAKKIIPVNDLAEYPLPTGQPYRGDYYLYSCPSCAKQFQVDYFLPEAGGDPMIWDIELPSLIR